MLFQKNKITRILFSFSIIFSLLLSVFMENASANSWRIKVNESAIVNNPIVTLGDIAEPLGNLHPSDWEQLKQIQLFAAPDKEGKAFQISQKKLKESLEYVLGDSAQYLLLPNSLAIQKNGALLREQDLMTLVQRKIQPYLGQLDGEAELTDYRLPPYVFLPTKGQSVDLELEKNDVKAGRISLKFYIREMDGSQIKRFTGSVFLNLWKNVPTPIHPYNRGDRLEADSLTFQRKNIAHINGEVWDGKGGPWQVKRSIGLNQAILLSDLEPLSMIRRGQLVNIQYKKGNVSIVQQGEALEDAGPGDIIKVRNTQSKKQIFGTVIDNKTVLIQ